MTNETTASQPTPHQNTLDAITGAIAYGRQGKNPPPSPDHWLAEYWSIGQQLAELGKTSAWDNVTPTASQPKSIGDDAIEAAALKHVATNWGALPVAAYRSGDYKQTEQFRRLKAFALELLDSRAPAAQASATIQAAPKTSFADYWWEARHERRTQEDHAKAAWDFVLKSAATIQEPVMVAEPVGVAKAASDLLDSANALHVDIDATTTEALTAFDRTRSRLQKALAAPMVADPAGVAEQNLELVIARLEQIAGNFTDDYRNAAEEALVCARSLAATVKAVPSEALDAGPFTLEQRMPPKGEEVLIYFNGSNGKMECRIDEWDDLHEDPIGMGGPTICVGEGWISYYEDNVTHWAPIPAVNFAAPLADKTAGT